MGVLDVMVDTETLGTVPGCVPLSIGAVGFDEDGLFNEFYVVIQRQTCEDAFLSVSPETLKWWESKSPEAREVLEQSLDAAHSLPLAAALGRFNTFLGRHGGAENVRLWGNGSDFDNALLACAYDAAKVKTGWRFWNNRCYRTLKNLAPDVPVEREGTYHNALDDAKTQARHLQQVLKAKGLVLS